MRCCIILCVSLNFPISIRLPWVPIHCVAGTIYLRQERIELAEYHFKRAIAIHPTSSVLQTYLGMVLNAYDRCVCVCACVCVNIIYTYMYMGCNVLCWSCLTYHCLDVM